ncbi:MAG: PQQ-like beta-propeller repeat protein [Planctomycetaceae bacterium]|nr:PQQ-like beta-propeller repeat protein [Planctomycetaceae bacterium]
MKTFGFAIICCTFALAAHAGDWTNWRGPHGNGTADGTSYPVEWSAEKNVAWSHPLEGVGASSPVVAAGRVFLTTTHEGRNLLLCVGMDGKRLWTQSLGDAVSGKQGQAGTGANPSCVTDGTLVYAYFKSGDLACFSLDGELKWTTNLQQRFGKDTLWWDLGTSPVLTQKAVIIACMQSDESYLAAFDKVSGDLLWKHERNLDAPEESAQSYSTPIVLQHDGQTQLIVLGADHVTAHNAESGAELWRVGTLNPEQNRYFRSIASASWGSGIVVAPYARGGSLTAIPLGGNGDVTKSHVLWTNKETSADVPTPAVIGDRVFVVRDTSGQNGTVDCLELATGKTIWSERLPQHRARYRSSPVAAEGRVYLGRDDGTVFVIDATADQLKVLAENRIAGESLLATPAFADGRILLRTETHLYLIEAAK